MKSLRVFLLTTVSLTVLSAAARAGDVTPGAVGPDPALYNWTGGYIGASVGAARLNGTCNQVNPSYGYYGACTGYYGGSGQATAASHVAASINAGYDWQVRSFVYGVVGDLTYAGLKNSVTQNYYDNGYGTYGGTYTAKIDWLASVRARMGLDVEATMVYLTGGVAFAEVKSGATWIDLSTQYNVGTLNSIQVGWVAGIGIEHKFTPNWSIKAECLYYDFGKSAAHAYSDGVNWDSQFTHEVITAQVGAAYHF